MTFELEEHALNYIQDMDLQWPLVIDTNRELYQYYGMEKAGFWDLWGLATWKSYLKEILKGNFPRGANDDVQQRGGDVLIDPAGMVRLHHIGKGPADRPSIEEILKIIESVDGKIKFHDENHPLKN